MKFWRRDRKLDQLESELRARRSEAPDQLVRMLANRARGETRWLRPGIRAAFAGGLVVVALVVVATAGGFSSVQSSTTAVVHVVKKIASPAKSKPAVVTRSPAKTQYGKTTICHRTGNGWVIITVDNDALPAHIAHGDTLVGPGDTCPGPPIVPPTAVTVRGGSAVHTGAGVQVRWQVSTENSVAGYRVYRERNGARVALNANLIPARFGTRGGSYSFVDAKAPKGNVQYWIRAVTVSGKSVWYGPLSASQASAAT
jgi:hypothetical protein